MAIYKFYNIQMLPIASDIKEIGSQGYIALFNSIGDFVQNAKESGYKLSSIAVQLRGEMYFAPFSVDEYDYPSIDGGQKLIYGHFLKFDDVNLLVDTNSGETEYRSKGNTSSKRYSFEFVFDPSNHILAIHHNSALPTRGPLITALKRIIEPHALRLFKMHSLEIDELTSADLIEEFLKAPKKGYKRYNGIVTFSNSDDFDDAADIELSRQYENELKDLRVGSWESNFKSFKRSVMSDLPKPAKAQLYLAARYGNAEVTYLDEDGRRQKFQMEDCPVRENLDEKQVKGIRNRVLEIRGLIQKAIRRTKLRKKNSSDNIKFVDDND